MIGLGLGRGAAGGHPRAHGARTRRYAETGKRLTWADMVQQGVVQRLRVQPEQVGLDKGPEPFIELWFGDLNHPDLGKSLLGDNGWNNLRLQLKEGEHAFFIIRTGGKESFKGSGFVRGGIYDRVQVRQGAGSFTFRDLDALNLYGLDAAGAPSYNESSHLHHPLGRVLCRLPLEAELPGQPRGPRHGHPQLHQL